jgi:hypothetical protein
MRLLQALLHTRESGYCWAQASRTVHQSSIEEASREKKKKKKSRQRKRSALLKKHQ